MSNARLYRFWCDLTEALRTGKPQNEIKRTGKPMFDAGHLPRKLPRIGRQVRLLQIPDGLRYRGRHRPACTVLATHYPHLKCTSYDLPVVARIAEKAIAAAGLGERVATASGDFFADPLPRADVITMGLILHDWNLDRNCT